MRKHLLIPLMLILSVILSGCAAMQAQEAEIVYPNAQAMFVSTQPVYTTTEEVVEESLLQPETQTITHNEVSQGYAWLYAKTQEGTTGTRVTTYQVQRNELMEEVSRVAIPSKSYTIDAQPTLIENGVYPQTGASFTVGQYTRYGVDCLGCNMSADGVGGTASGIGVSKTAVRQADGTWLEGITYEGYYLAAASTALPFCTVLKLTGHNLSGYNGVTNDQPIYVLVVDRGGSVSGAAVDLFIGSQANSIFRGQQAGVHPQAEIVGFLTYTRNAQGQRICAN